MNTLVYGDQFSIHAWGQVYTYEVRQKFIVSPDELSVLEHKDLDWVTLITCRGYDQDSQSYLSRDVIQAVLISVESE